MLVVNGILRLFRPAGHPAQAEAAAPTGGSTPARCRRRKESCAMISRFFIERPIFANVIAVITMIIGLVCFLKLPVEQYPKIVPPTIQVSTRYPEPAPRWSPIPWHTH